MRELALPQIVSATDYPQAVRVDEEVVDYVNAVRALGLKAKDCLAVEDSHRGLASARGAGVPCVVVPTELTVGSHFPGRWRSRTS